MEPVVALRKYRETTGETLEKVSAAFGVNKSTWLRWEEGIVLIPAERLVRLEAVTGISRHDLRPDLSAIFAEAQP